MKKILGILLIIAVIVPFCMAMFVGCQTPTDYEHTILFYTSQGADLGTTTAIAIKNFEDKYPGWKVEHVRVGGYDDVKEKVIADFQGKNQPDLAYCYADHVAQYLKTGKVVDLNTLINSTETVTAAVRDDEGNIIDEEEVVVGYTKEELDDFVKGYYEEGYASNFGNYDKYGYSADALLTLPFVKSTDLMYYNKDALDALNLKPAKTWDELWSQCALLKTKYPSAYPFAYDSEANWFITMCEQNGWGYTNANAPHYVFNTPEAASWLKELNGYFGKKYITTKETYQAYTSGLFIKGVDGGAIYCVGSSGGASHQNPGSAFNWGVAPIPGSKLQDGTVNSASISQGPNLVLLEGGNNVQNVEEKKMMTFLFLKELLDPTFQASFAMQSGYNPVRLSTYENEEYSAFINGTSITAVAAKVANDISGSFFTSPAFIGSSTARTQVGNVVLYSLAGSKSPEKALADAVANCGGNK